MITLYGSTTSPYVRRFRLLLNKAPYQFEKINLADLNDREKLKTLSPLLKIPLITDEGTKIWDSRQIFRYLQEKGMHQNTNWDQENLLTAIDGISDSLIQLYLVERSGTTMDRKNTYGKANLDRIDLSSEFLDQAVSQNKFNQWNYLSISLYCLIDWANFRERYDFKKYQNLWSWYLENAHNDGIKETDPRNS
ncbi:MAG: glutathione S-transferase [Bdellovibrio sp. CG12_big_fil_rev_8_21_14_0_65_39_13]|nr:MAG: glutathione S-transferase [Bdellovibrio sp. CG22_combo_CG10-13_8_21_14_all_39_27]PIQ59118.1 MAG: glutathione S-transferase [Bdellovibrio sp. CG12_big_fil_rev_8_21_14_0_65_39_13]PIR33685.1 MAG: glutathione S-transferase [Bdellovibrio sp. CG11_big_fil_rev_8_21_14_0_20_39_38]